MLALRTSPYQARAGKSDLPRPCRGVGSAPAASRSVMDLARPTYNKDLQIGGSGFALSYFTCPLLASLGLEARPDCQQTLGGR